MQFMYSHICFLFRKFHFLEIYFSVLQFVISFNFEKIEIFQNFFQLKIFKKKIEIFQKNRNFPDIEFFQKKYIFSSLGRVGVRRR